MKRKRKKKHHHPKEDPIWMEGHIFNERTGRMEPVRYKIKRYCW